MLFPHDEKKSIAQFCGELSRYVGLQIDAIFSLGSYENCEGLPLRIMNCNCIHLLPVHKSKAFPFISVINNFFFTNPP